MGESVELLMVQTVFHIVRLNSKETEKGHVTGSMTTSGPSFLSVGEFVFQQATNPVVYYAGLYFTEDWRGGGGNLQYV